MGTLTTGNIKAGALESSDSPASNTYLSYANSTVTQYESTAYTAGGQEIETFDFTENGLSTGEAFVYEKSGAGKLQGYPGFCIVSDQTNGSQVFVDRGPNNHQITVAGHTHHDSGGSKYLHNPTSIYFDGTGDYLTILGHHDLVFGTGDFTIDFWINFGAGSIYHTILSYGYTASGGLLLQTDAGAAPKMRVFSDASSAIVESSTASLNTWYHYAIVRNADTIKIYRGGAETITGSASGDDINGAHNENAYIGAKGDASYPLNGYMDDIRIIKGKAIYTHDFTPPSRSPKDTRAYGDVADYTKITMMGYRSDISSYFTAINYVAGDEVVARDYMGIGYDDLKSAAYSGSTQKIMVYNTTSNTVKFTAYVEATT